VGLARTSWRERCCGRLTSPKYCPLHSDLTNGPMWSSSSTRPLAREFGSRMDLSPPTLRAFAAGDVVSLVMVGRRVTVDLWMSIWPEYRMNRQSPPTPCLEMISPLMYVSLSRDMATCSSSCSVKMSRSCLPSSTMFPTIATFSCMRYLQHTMGVSGGGGVGLRSRAPVRNGSDRIGSAEPCAAEHMCGADRPSARATSPAAGGVRGVSPRQPEILPASAAEEQKSRNGSSAKLFEQVHERRIAAAPSSSSEPMMRDG
jgi:hypothetical protein